MTEQDLPAHFRQALEELGPTFVKLGQVLSTRPDLLPPSYIAELRKLQDAVPPVPWEAIRDAITQELGRPPEEVFASIDPEPLGAASLGQVHAATLADGAEVVIKVQRPNIQPTIATDLEILQALAPAAQRTPEGKIHDFVAEADDFAYTLNNELDYRLEGRNADRFRANFANEHLLHVPLVYWEYTTSRVLVLERIRGVKIDDVAAVEEAGYDRHQVAENAARMVLKEVLEDGYFHADVHPGNFVVMPGEVIGVMDFGKMGTLSDRDRTDAIGFYVAVMSVDPDGIVDVLVRMGAVDYEVDRKGFTRDIERVLQRYYDVSMGDIRIQGLADVIMPIINRYHVRLPSNFGLLLQTLGMMQGVALTLDPDFDVWAFSEKYVRRVARRLARPRRELAPKRAPSGTGVERSDRQSASHREPYARKGRARRAASDRAERHRSPHEAGRSPDDPAGAEPAAGRTHHQPGSGCAGGNGRQHAAVAGDDWLCRGGRTDRLAVRFDPDRFALNDIDRRLARENHDNTSDNTKVSRH